MAWPLVKLIPKKTHFGFVRFAFFASFVSVALVLASFGSMISAGYRQSPVTLYEQATGSPLDRMGSVLNQGFNLGIDFTGGTIVTMDAGEPVRQIHDRQPVILDPDAYDAWLNPETPVSELKPILTGRNLDGALQFHRVGRYVNSNKSHGPECIVPVEAA